MTKLNLTKSLEYNLRFWYEMGGDEDIRFTPEELKEIRKVSLARILCDNTKDVTRMQPQAFMTSDSNDNKEVSCDDTSKIPKLDITQFQGLVERTFRCRDLNGRLAEKSIFLEFNKKIF